MKGTMLNLAILMTNMTVLFLDWDQEAAILFILSMFALTYATELNKN